MPACPTLLKSTAESMHTLYLITHMCRCLTRDWPLICLCLLALRASKTVLVVRGRHRSCNWRHTTRLAHKSANGSDICQCTLLSRHHPIRICRPLRYPPLRQILLDLRDLRQTPRILDQILDSLLLTRRQLRSHALLCACPSIDARTGYVERLALDAADLRC